MVSLLDYLSWEVLVLKSSYNLISYSTQELCYPYATGKYRYAFTFAMDYYTPHEEKDKVKMGMSTYFSNENFVPFVQVMKVRGSFEK